MPAATRSWRLSRSCRRATRRAARGCDRSWRRQPNSCERRIHLLILDVLSPTSRSPGYSWRNWEEITGEDYEAPAGEPLTLAAYESAQTSGLTSSPCEPAAICARCRSTWNRAGMCSCLWNAPIPRLLPPCRDAGGRYWISHENSSFSVLPLITRAALCTAAYAQDKPAAPPADRFVLTKVRLLPKPGTANRLAGARVTGSNEGPTNAFVALAKIDRAPADEAGWNLPLPQPGLSLREVRIGQRQGRGPGGTRCPRPAGRLQGKPFGTSGPKGSSGNTFQKAFDGDPKTWFEAPTGHGYVGIDLGAQAQAPAPRFTPDGGPYARPQKVQIGVWPPGATIRYTTDGSTPTATNGGSTEGRSPWPRTRASRPWPFKNGLADSNVSVASYLIGPGVAATEVKSYHLGNSLTDTVNGYLEPIAASTSKNLMFMRKTIPGCAISMNWRTPGQGFGSPAAWATDYNIVFAKKVDHLFLQPFPNPPGLKEDGEFGGKFIAAARKQNPDVQVWLYAQWPALGSWHNDAHCTGAGWMQPPWFPPNRKPAAWEEGMANKMAYYLDLKKIPGRAPGKRPIRLCPGGPALVRIKREIEAGKVPGMTDFRADIFSDDIHLSRPGRYLVSLVHFACMYGENPQGKVTFANSGLTKEQAAIFQRHRLGDGARRALDGRAAYAVREEVLALQETNSSCMPTTYGSQNSIFYPFLLPFIFLSSVYSRTFFCPHLVLRCA